MIQGFENPDSGHLTVGKSVKIASVSQDRDEQLSTGSSTGSSSVFEEISGGQDFIQLGTHEVPSRAYCSWFGFKVRM
jgi:energy-dependent translational throttle protein EttA